MIALLPNKKLTRSPCRAGNATMNLHLTHNTSSYSYFLAPFLTKKSRATRQIDTIERFTVPNAVFRVLKEKSGVTPKRLSESK